MTLHDLAHIIVNTAFWLCVFAAVPGMLWGGHAIGWGIYLCVLCCGSVKWEYDTINKLKNKP